MGKDNKVTSNKYMAGDIRHLINDAIQNELSNLPKTQSEVSFLSQVE